VFQEASAQRTNRFSRSDGRFLLVGLQEGMRTLTDFGDAAVLLPLSVVILVWLLSDDSRRVVGSWLIAVGLCAATTASLKIYLGGGPDLVGRVSLLP
jgi:hypothetical protein